MQALQRWSLVAVLLSGGLLLAADEPKKTRNPLNVQDVEDPDGKDVQDYAAKIKLKGDGKDANAEQWVKEATKGKKGTLEGEWSERWKEADGDWNYSKGPAKIKVVGERVYILVEGAGGKYLADLKRDKNRLIGRYHNLDNLKESGPCVFEVVDSERIDGAWADGGRWDFRRKLEK